MATPHPFHADRSLIGIKKKEIYLSPKSAHQRSPKQVNEGGHLFEGQGMAYIWPCHRFLIVYTKKTNLKDIKIMNRLKGKL
jgi:hypothetical protein